MRNRIKNSWLTSVSIVVSITFPLLLSCSKAEDDSQEYARQLVPGSLQVLGNSEKIWFFIEFEQIYRPLKKVRTWDHPGFIKTGARQWILEYKEADGTIGSHEMNAPANKRLSWNPNLAHLFFASSGWHALTTESMFTQTAIYRMEVIDGAFHLLEDYTKELALSLAPIQKVSKMQNAVDELSAKSGYTYLHSNLGIHDETFAFGGINYTLQLKGGGDCYELFLLKDSKPVGNGAALKICPENLIVTERELKTMPNLMGGKPKATQ